MALIGKRPFGLYLHWPFCLAKCPYCDFNSHVSASVDFDQFGDALCQEMQYMASLLPKHKMLSSLFFGGGTPSLMPPELVERLITYAEELFGFDPDIEITAEANPTSVEAAKMLDFQRAGVNRVSMGVQSFDDKILKFLGRKHSSNEALRALDMVRSVFDRVSIDLIYATPGQSTTAWRNMLSKALDLGLSHLSLYQLTIEEGTVFYNRQRRGELKALNDDRAATLYDITQELTNAAGLPAYEISNHAAPGNECQHNMIYWHGGDWIGVGPGAHGRFTHYKKIGNDVIRAATLTRRSPSGWLAAVLDNGHGIDQSYNETATGWATEKLMMGMRLTAGINLAEIETLCGPQADWLNFSGLHYAVENGLLIYDRNSGQLYASASGRLRLNSLLSIIIR
jgi:putative oxygen-independent coproporphyrinogen III oxidase